MLFGAEGRDEIDGMNGNDIIVAGEGDDLINGGSGNDLVLAGAGDDTIISGDGGYDVAWGGDGADTFVFSDAFAEDNSRDKTIIADFDVAEDMIDLGGAEISNVRDFGNTVRITLDGGEDQITLLGVSNFDEIVFTNEFDFV